MASSSQIDFNNQAIQKQDLQKALTYGVVQGIGTTPAVALTYEEFSLTTTITGTGGTTGNCVLVGVKIGNYCYASWKTPGNATISGSTATTTVALDSRLRPATQQNGLSLVYNTGATAQGSYQVASSGIITLGAGATLGNFTTSGGCIAGAPITWCLL